MPSIQTPRALLLAGAALLALPLLGAPAARADEDGSAPGLAAPRGLQDGRIPVFAGGGHNGQEVAYLDPAPPAAPVPAMTVVVATVSPPAPRPLPTPAVAEMAQARAELATGHVAAGRAAIEQAETTLLNARAEGEHGWHAPIQQLEQALAALDQGATAQALAALPG